MAITVRVGGRSEISRTPFGATGSSMNCTRECTNPARILVLSSFALEAGDRFRGLFLKFYGACGAILDLQNIRGTIRAQNTMRLFITRL